jgi:cyclic pyranopterin phosphate synthase
MSREMNHGERLTHLDEAGRAQMVDVGDKDVTRRRAVARAEVSMAPGTLDMILAGGAAKGDVLAVARLAGIMAAKHASELIPLCHLLPLDAVGVRFRVGRAASGQAVLEIEAVATTTGRTGVEMETLVAASIAGLTVYDMCKARDRSMEVGRVRLVHKSGGRSGEYRRDAEEEWEQWL